MASGWTIHTFDRAQWDALFGSQSAEAAQHVVDAVLWDEAGYFAADGINPGPNRAAIITSETGDRVLELAGHLAWQGFTYKGQDAPTVALIDQLGAFMWADEALGGTSFTVPAQSRPVRQAEAGAACAGQDAAVSAAWPPLRHR
jgi:hypothetical protein